ncbi:MAG: acyl-CoA/acyl-ACP dehydrogenase [Rhodothermales bacterium]|nr:acyl-CoA/acyl-ACP dehydrogenase [Rhodothermales bacterium]
MGIPQTMNVVPKEVPFDIFIGTYREKLKELFSDESTVERLRVQRRFPDSFLSEVRQCRPLSTFISKEYGGRGGHVHEALSMLEESSYQSLALSLTFGINGALFLQPLHRYGDAGFKQRVYNDFISGDSLGGLMITEPDYGSDALSMQTHFTDTDSGYKINGTKHWGGLTGMADYWLVTARRKDEADQLARDIDFFVVDVRKDDQEIVVEELFQNLGLYPIQYGRNLIDVSVAADQRLNPSSTGIKLMLDTLHRSRIEFPGMGMGFLRRMLDEAVQHCKERFVGGSSLFSYDQVKSRLSKIQAYYTTCSAMCAYSSEHADIQNDLSKYGLQANVIKSILTDFMQTASQSLLQLVGAKGYCLDHIAGSATVDCRPFQIFEGPNDILYQQISESVLKSMRRLKEVNLFSFLSKYDLSSRASQHVKEILDFIPDRQMPQRHLVELGQLLGRLFSMEFVIELGDRGYRPSLITNCISVLSEEMERIASSFSSGNLSDPTEDYLVDSAWLSFVRA